MPTARQSTADRLTTEDRPTPQRTSVGRLLAIVLALTVLSACGGDPWWLPRAHKISIQQGNLLSERQIESVAIGMPAAEVRTLLGEPITRTPFHGNRWDYLFTRTPAGSVTEARRLSIYYESGVVSRIDATADSVTGELPEQRNWWERLFPPAEERDEG